MHTTRSSLKLSIWLTNNDAAAKGPIAKVNKSICRKIAQLRNPEQWPMSARQCWLLLLLVTFALLALGALLKVTLLLRDEFVQEILPDKYAVYIDGGSSGTRVRVFRYQPARWPSYIVLDLPEPSLSVEPGLSAYATQPEEAAESIKPLLEFAYEHVPRHLWLETPVRLLATAGLRLLSSESQDNILAACEHVLWTSGFLFQPGWATVIDGEMEGLYGWAAVNYVTGALQEAAGHAYHSRKEVMDPSQLFTGLLEMGGASMQVTFLPPASIKLSDKHGSHLHLPGVPSRLYTHSYLGLGMDSALARASEYVLQQQQPEVPNIADPCLPIGYTSDDGRYGNASFTECLSVVSRILPEYNCSFGSTTSSFAATTARGRTTLARDSAAFTSTAPMSSTSGGPVGGEGCTLQGSYVPVLAGEFVALENFAWTARALGLPESATLRELREHGHRYCARHWSSLHAEFSGHIPDQFLVRYCFGAAYILELLHRGLGLGLDDNRVRWANTVRKDGDGEDVGVSWVLGAAVVDAMNSGTQGHGSTEGFIAEQHSGVTGTQRFWLRDERGMAGAGMAAARMRKALLLPVAVLAISAGFVLLVLLRAAGRRGGARGGPVEGGGYPGDRNSSGGAAGVAGGGDPAGSRGVERFGGEGDRAAVASAVWSPLSASTSSIAARPVSGMEARGTTGGLDTGLGLGLGPAVGRLGASVGGANSGAAGPASALEGGVLGARHGGVLKAAVAISTALRRNASYTSIFMGADNGGGNH